MSCMDHLSGRRGRRLGELFLHIYFGPYGGREIGKQLITLKRQTKQFMYNFLEWVRVHIGDRSWFMMDFVEWVSSK